MARIGLLPLARGTFDVAYAEERHAALKAALEGAGHVTLGGERLLFDRPAALSALEEMRERDLDLLLVAQVTFSDAGMIVEIADAGIAPLAIWAFPEPRTGGRLRLNSFCGLNLAAHALGLRGASFSWAYHSPESGGVASILDDMLTGRRKARPRAPRPPDAAPQDRSTARGVLDALDGKRIGRIGERPDGFFTCDYEPRSLETLAGIKVEEIGLGELFKLAGAADEETVAAARAEAAVALKDMDTVDQQQLERSLRLRGALEALRQTGDYSGFAVRCWPETFTEYGGAVCGPMGMMGERTVPCACEADVHGALTNLILQEIAKAPAFLADLVDLDGADGTGVLWHCGQAPVSMRDPEVQAKTAVHSNRRMPLLFEFPLKPGRVTLARVSRAGGSLSMFVAGGEMLRRPLAFGGTAGVIRFDAPIADVEDMIVGSGIEHHTSLVYGDHRAALGGVAAEAGLSLRAI